MTLLGYVDSMRCHYTYVNDRVGKCNRLDKCGYHYTPHQYFEDNPWLRSEDSGCSFFSKHRVFERTNKEQRRTRHGDGVRIASVRSFQNIGFSNERTKNNAERGTEM